MTFYLTGVSRSLTHELIRHRHFSYSQLSQRYVPERDAAMVEPAVIAEDPELHERFLAATDAARRAPTPTCWRGWRSGSPTSPNATLRRKQARQAARAVLPNATETRIVVTGNYRAWRHFIAMRASEHADVEIRELAVACLRELQRVAAQRVRRLPDQRAGRRHRGRREPARHRGLSTMTPDSRPSVPATGVDRHPVRGPPAPHPRARDAEAGPHRHRHASAFRRAAALRPLRAASRW